MTLLPPWLVDKRDSYKNKNREEVEAYRRGFDDASFFILNQMQPLLVKHLKEAINARADLDRIKRFLKDRGIKYDNNRYQMY